jgi:hypothetical protein
MTYAHQKPASCSGCPLHETGKGFVLGCGDPQKAKYAIILEAPGTQEIQFSLTPNAKRFVYSSHAECDAELARRRRDYPELTNGSIRVGVPAVGPTGLALDAWIMRKVGISRDDCFIDNTIRCLPPRSKSGAQYPTGETKKAAEKHCRRYDRIASFRPDTVLLSLHPAGLLREITPLPLVIKDFEKLRDFATQGRKSLALLGSKAAAAFVGYGSNSTKWRGHYAVLAQNWAETYAQRFEYAKRASRTKKVAVRPTELTESCASCKRYRGKAIPKNPCATCWDRYEANVQVPA